MTLPTTMKTKKLVDMLYDATTQGEIEWQLGFDEDTVETKLGKNFVQLIQEDEDDPADGTVTVILVKNENGDVVDRIYPGILHGEKTSIDGYTKYWQVFDAIYSTATRMAKGVEKTLDEVIAELQKKVIPF